MFVEAGGLLVRVQWRERGSLVKRSWSNTAGNRALAIAWARGFAETREQIARPPMGRLSLREMWERYTTSEFPHLRGKTVRNYSRHWSLWETFAGRHIEADLVTADMLDDFRAALQKRGLAVSQQRSALAMVKQVFRWAMRRELLARDRVSLYRFRVAKEERPKGVAEYTADEYTRLLAALDPRKRSQWRAWSLVMLIGELGPRVNAALHLRWDDVEFSTGAHGAVRWTPEYDKLGHDRTQPMTERAQEALLVALGWSRLDEARSGWVFYGARRGRRSGRSEKDGTYSVQSFLWMLRETERRSGVVHIARRGAHGFRRMVMGNALEVTGNVVDAMYFIGDTDLRQARKYAKERDRTMQGVADKLTQWAAVNQAVNQAVNAATELATVPQPSPDAEGGAQGASAPSPSDALTRSYGDAK